GRFLIEFVRAEYCVCRIVVEAIDGDVPIRATDGRSDLDRVRTGPACIVCRLLFLAYSCGVVVGSLVGAASWSRNISLVVESLIECAPHGEYKHEHSDDESNHRYDESRYRSPFSGSSGSRVWVGSESAGVEERSCDVVGEVAEPEGRAAQVFQSSIDRLGRSVGGAGAVEVGQHICGASLQRPSEFAQLAQGGGNAV